MEVIGRMRGGRQLAVNLNMPYGTAMDGFCNLSHE